MRKRIDYARRRTSRAINIGEGELYSIAISMSDLESDRLQKMAEAVLDEDRPSMNELFRRALRWHHQRHYPHIDLPGTPDRWERYMRRLQRMGVIRPGGRSRFLVRTALDYAKWVRRNRGKEARDE